MAVVAPIQRRAEASGTATVPAIAVPPPVQRRADGDRARPLVRPLAGRRSGLPARVQPLRRAAEASAAPAGRPRESQPNADTIQRFRDVDAVLGQPELPASPAEPVADRVAVEPVQRETESGHDIEEREMGGANEDELIERVMRRLLRRLAIDAERRGLTPWR